jgi:hypothetical protein
MTPPSASRALGTAARFLPAPPMPGARALVMRLRAARGEGHARPNGAEIRSEP